jgi:hypothetical protein
MSIQYQTAKRVRETTPLDGQAALLEPLGRRQIRGQKNIEWSSIFHLRRKLAGRAADHDRLMARLLGEASGEYLHRTCEVGRDGDLDLRRVSRAREERDAQERERRAERG